MDVGLDFGGGGYSLQGQLDKIDYDMTKAGFPKSAIFLALHNECKKHQAKELAEHHFMQYKKHRDIEEQMAAKNDQPQAYQSLSYAASLVPKHFPVDSAKKNSDAFIASCERYLPCPENTEKMVHHMVSNGVAPTVEGFYHTFWILYNGGQLKRHDWDQQTYAIKKKPPVAFSGYDVSPDLYNQQLQEAQKQQAAASLGGLLGGVALGGMSGALGGVGGGAGLVGEKFYGKGLAELIKGQEPTKSVEFQQAVMHQIKKDWGGGSDKAPPPAPKPKPVDSVPDHGGARRFRDEED
jgi:hypothetical protein